MRNILRELRPMLAGATALLFLGTQEARASFYLTAQGGATLSAPTDNRGSSYTVGRGYGGNLGLGVVSGFLGLELNGLYLKRSFTASSRTVSMTWVQIPALIRIWFGSIFSIGAGPYYAIALGSYDSTTSGITRSPTYGSSGLKTSDIGAVGSALLNLFPNSLIGITLEGRFSRSIQNAATTGSIYYQDAQVIGGFRLGAQ